MPPSNIGAHFYEEFDGLHPSSMEQFPWEAALRWEEREVR
jgi:hypothetical protein